MLFVKYLRLNCSLADDCIYVQKGEGYILIVSLYVDDLSIACCDDDTRRAIKLELFNRFMMKHLGEFPVMLGMDITRD